MGRAQGGPGDGTGRPTAFPGERGRGEVDTGWGQWMVDVDGEQKPVNSGRLTEKGGHKPVDSERWTVDSKWKTVDGG